MSAVQPASRRIDSLDALRGVAAMVVVLHHCAMTMPGVREAIMATGVLRPLVAGPSAVSVFFVLSGMVLFLAFEGSDAFHYRPYIIKRLARIYLPLAAAVLLSVALYFLVAPRPVPGLSAWFNDLSWNQRPTAKLVAGHLLLLDPWRFSSLDNVIWSLVHEMRISIIFPLLAFAIRAKPWATLAAATIISWAAAWAAAAGIAMPLIDPLPTLGYLVLFAAGAFLGLRRELVRRWIARRPAWWQTAFLMAGVALLCTEDLPGAATWIGLGAVAVVVACFAAPVVERWLLHPVLVWLGKVSYSLYLLHLLLLLTLVHLLGGRVPVAALLALVPPLSLVAAAAGCRWIEQPSIALGRWFARRR